MQYMAREIEQQICEQYDHRLIGTPYWSSLVHHFINTPTYILRSGGRRQQGALVELSEKFLQVLACELPIERLRLGFPVVLKIE